MLNQLQGPLGRRYLPIALFVVLVFFLLHSYGPAGLPTRHGGGGGGSSSSGVHYVPSTIDWSKERLFHPVDEVKPLPSGQPKALPKIQIRPTAEGKDATNESRKEKVKKAFIKSWDAYKKLAWPMDELMPISGKGKTTFSGWAAQIVDALDMLWILDLKDEFHLAVQEVATINWSEYEGTNINVFEVTIRYLGGLLSAYDLSGEKALLDKAIELGDALYMAFDTPNHLPTHWLIYANAKDGRTTADTSISGAASGSLCVEFTRLSQITGDSKYYDATERVKMFFYDQQNSTKLPGLWPDDFNFRDGELASTLYTFGAGADSQYEYLPKMHALLGGLDPEYVEMAVKSLDAGRDHLLYRPMTPKDENVLLAGSLDMRGSDPALNWEMQHLTCFTGGMYAMAGKLLERKDYVDLGSRLAAGCVWAYDAFPTNIMPDGAKFIGCDKLDGPCPYNESLFHNENSMLPGGIASINSRAYLLRPEAIESVFYMWRITGDSVWREAAWRMWEGIVKETETDIAFACIRDATVLNSEKSDSMETFWMAETIKYFYLTFADESVINLDEWVFNTEAHPLKRPVAPKK